MISTLGAAVLILAADMVIGQAILRGLGVRHWTWLAPAIGMVATMIVATTALFAPGRAVTAFALLCAATAISIWIVARDRALWPDAVGLAAGLPVLGLALIPFAAAGRSGIPGVSLNNDMSGHLIAEEALRSPAIDTMYPLLDWYPVGVHALVAALTDGLPLSEVHAFTGFAISLPVVLGWTALHGLRNPVRWAAFPVAIIVGMPFMVAAYYGQGAFKEPLLAVLILGSMLLLARPLPTAALARWVPLGLLVAGALVAYSYPGATWPLLFLTAWIVVRIATITWRRRSLRAPARGLRVNAIPALVAIGITMALVLPQIPRMVRFAQWQASGGIRTDDIGNLAGPLPLWEVLGVWNGSDFRMPGPPSAWVALGATIVAIAVAHGAIWALQRGEWMMVLAPVLTVALWAWSDRNQSAYVTAKMLVVLAPMLMLLAIRPFVERAGPDAPQHDKAARYRPAWMTAGATALVAIELMSTVGILRASPVGPMDQYDDIARVTEITGKRPTLFLGNDDFTAWMFRTTPARSPVMGLQLMRFRPEKPFEYGRTYDIDSLDPRELDGIHFIVAPRDAAASEIPPEFRQVAETATLRLYERVSSRLTRRMILAGEAGTAGARLDCATAAGQRVAASGGVASIRPDEVRMPGATIAAGAEHTIQLPLARGSWDLVASYVGARPIRVTADGLPTTLPPYLGRPGPRWPIGRLDLPVGQRVAITFAPTATWLTPDSGSHATSLIEVVAVKTGGNRVVPVREACGEVVDWYRPGGRAG